MKKIVSVLSVLVLTVSVGVVQAGAETVQEKCERLEREGEKLPPECMKIPLPENPNPAPQPTPTPTPSEEPPHEAWESPNAGGGDSGSSKPDKPEKPARPAKPVKEPTTSGSDSGSKKPSGSSSTGDKKPTGSSSNSGGVSSNGSGRPDTVCGGEFCGDGDTLIGGTGNANDRWPGMNKPSANPTGETEGQEQSSYPDVVRPADRNTLQENIGTVIETGDGLAIRRGEEIVLISPTDAKALKVGERVELGHKNTKDTSSRNEKSDGSFWGNGLVFANTLVRPQDWGTVQFSKDTAYEESVKYFPDSEGYTGDDDKRDAARHCIFIGIIAADATPNLAQNIANDHELVPPLHSNRPGAAGTPGGVMDQHNNWTAVNIGRKYGGTEDSSVKVINECVTLARNAQKVEPGECPDFNGQTLVYMRDPYDPFLADTGEELMDVSHCPVKNEQP